MKIVHIITNLGVGGAERLLCDLTSDLSSHEHHVIYFKKGALESELPPAVIKKHIQGLWFIYDPILLIKIVKVLLQIRPDVVHSSLWASNVVAAFATFIMRIPLVVAVHLPTHQDDGSTVPFYKRILDRFVYWQAEAIVAVSDEIGAKLRVQYPQHAHKVCVIINGIPHQKIRALANDFKIDRGSLGLSGKDFVIGTVGRLVPFKNQAMLIRILPQLKEHLPQVRLLIVGQGPLEQELKALAAELGVADCVIITFVTPAYGVYQCMDLFILPSWYEGLPLVLLEAMACERPVIVSDRTAVINFIQYGENGILFDPANEQELIDTIVMLAQDSEQRTSLDQQARRLVEQRFDSKRMANEYLATYKDVMQ